MSILGAIDHSFVDVDLVVLFDDAPRGGSRFWVTLATDKDITR